MEFSGTLLDWLNMFESGIRREEREIAFKSCGRDQHVDVTNERASVSRVKGATEVRRMIGDSVGEEVRAGKAKQESEPIVPLLEGGQTLTALQRVQSIYLADAE